MKIKVGGIFYKVIYKRNLKDDSTDVWGYVDYAQTKIYIEKKLSKQKQNQTLTHEVLHAIFHEAGLDNIANDEKIILPLGYVLYQFEKENKIK